MRHYYHKKYFQGTFKSYFTGVIFLSIIFFGFFGLAGRSEAADYYVSPTGSDSNPGTIDEPWQHIAYATCGGSYGCPVATANSNKLQAGDTLHVREGTYKERDILVVNSGTGSGYITIANYSDENVLIDGNTNSLVEGSISTCATYDGSYQCWCCSGLTGCAAGGAAAAHPVFVLDGADYIKIENMNIKNACKAGIRIGENQESRNIIIDHNHIYNTYERDNTAPIYFGHYGSEVVVSNNLLHGNILRGETSGRGAGVELFVGDNSITIENNEIYDTMIGLHYKHGMAGSANTPIFRNNVIHDLTQGGKTGQSGIRASTDNLIVENNLLYNITTDGRGVISIYHEDAGCDKVGSFNNIVRHNTIVNASYGITLKATEGGCLDRAAINTSVRDNLEYGIARNPFRIWQYNNGPGDNTSSDYNLFPVAGSYGFARYNNFYSNLANWQSATGLDAHSVSGNPAFVDYNGKDFTLAAGSLGKNTASDSTDMGADISLVGIQGGQTPDTTPPASPTGLSVQ